MMAVCGAGMMHSAAGLECGAWSVGRNNQSVVRNKEMVAVRCNVGKDGKSKKAPVRLPGGPNMPAYGSSSGGFSRSQPGLGQFRPPSPFGPPIANETTQEEEARIAAVLEQIRVGLGTWQERAVGISELQRMGFGSEEVYTQAYVPAPTQTSMVVAAQVYRSLEEAGCSPELLSWFDEPKVEVLYSLRTLSARQRGSAAEYVSDNDLDVAGALELAKAIKDHERRPEGRQGFSTAPGDCLAFSLHRAAVESMNAEERSAFIKRGLSVAVTDSAKHRFSEF